MVVLLVLLLLLLLLWLMVVVVSSQVVGGDGSASSRVTGHLVGARSTKEGQTQPLSVADGGGCGGGEKREELGV